jgi:hypothetical protein
LPERLISAAFGAQLYASPTSGRVHGNRRHISL